LFPTFLFPLFISKQEKEVDAIRLRPHPYEFMLYFDI